MSTKIIPTFLDIGNNCENWEFECSGNFNYSGSGECIPGHFLCDGDNDCDNGSDEQKDFCGL